MISKKAEEFARKRHEGEVRKFNGEPYFNHVKRVAENVREFKKSHNQDELIAAAFLHDVLEDTETNYFEIEENFGDLVASIVKELTNNRSKIEFFSKGKYLGKKMANPKKMSNWALAIKLADRLDNVSDLKTASPEFCKEYSEQTFFIMDYLEKYRDLSNTHKTLIKEIRKKLGKLI